MSEARLRVGSISSRPERHVAAERARARTLATAWLVTWSDPDLDEA